MNARFKNIVSRIQTRMSELNQSGRLHFDFKPRHAEHLAAAGFGYVDLHSYLVAVDKGIERCTGYYIPDTSMIRSRMPALGYPTEVLQELELTFVPAATSGDGATRADLYDDLRGPRELVGGANVFANYAMLTRCLEEDVMREDGRLWSVLESYGIAYDYETEDNTRCTIELPRDFPSLHDLQQTVDARLVVRYDLEQGEDEEALFFNTNRMLEWRGTARLKPSGKRGWSYPTIKLDPTPTIDDRTSQERLGEFASYEYPDFDQQLFDDGGSAASAGSQVLPGMEPAYLAGWILNAYGANGTGHMSTGQLHKAFYGALVNAEDLVFWSKRQQFELAADACRFLASRRVVRDLEELIEESRDELVA
jgi:hypothetical protein